MSSSFSLLPLLLILSLLPLLSSARPCKTLFVSYYTVTTATSSSTFLDSTPASASLDAASASDHPYAYRFFAVYRIVPHLAHRQAQPDRIPNRLAGISPSSLQDRAKDILIVVAGLIFGLGCGAITASTMYLVWSLLFAADRDASPYDDFSDSDVESPKKMGYVKISADPVPKEGYEAAN